MTAITNKTQIWFYATCDETSNFTSKSKHFNSNTQIPKRENGVGVKEYDNNKPKVDEIDFILVNFF